MLLELYRAESFPSTDFRSIVDALKLTCIDYRRAFFLCRVNRYFEIIEISTRLIIYSNEKESQVNNSRCEKLGAKFEPFEGGK